MTSGHCLCGEVRYEYAGQALAFALCHCLDCRMISGSTNSASIVIKTNQFNFTKGEPKTYTSTVDSGAQMTSHFCGTCGVTIFRISDALADTLYLRAGTLDKPETLNKAKIALELYVSRKVDFLAPVEGAGQIPEQPSGP